MQQALSSIKYIQFSFLFIVFSVILVGCASKPTQPPIATNAKLQTLKNTPMPKRLAIPVAGVNSKNLRDTWGASRSSGRTHEGIDIMAPTGTKVYAATDGYISSLKSNNLGGTVIWQIGPAGTWHYYAHLDRHKRGLKEGDFVKQGDHIGYVGYSGNASKSAPHLHYGIYLSGKGRGATNPFPYLK